MNGWTWIRKIIPAFLLTLAFAEGAAVNTRIGSAFLARGEKTLLEIRVEGTEPDRMPVVPEVKDVVVESLGFGPPRIIAGRRILYSFQYVVSSYEVGKHTIPSVDVVVGGVTTKSAPIEIEVFDPSELEWSEASSEPENVGDRFRYSSIIKVPDKKIYENQTVKTEIKIYVPQDLARSVADWGIPEFERDGLAVWRYEPSESRGEVNLLGQPYVSLAYQTTMTALKSGPVTIGPAKIRLTYVKMIFDRFTQRMQVNANLEVPSFQFDVAPLPEGAPEGFDNAVGEFTIGTAIKETEVTEGEPLALDVIVNGSGNLDNLRSPEMIDATGWKVYDATPEQRGEERREVSGTVVFSQFIRPLEMKTSVPPFRLVFFDPEKEEYRTIMTEAIPLAMTPSAVGRNFEASGPPQALPIPVERMTDILGLIETGNIVSKKGGDFPWWIAQVLASVLALGLIAKALWMRYAHLFEKDETKAFMKKDFENLLSAKSRDGLSFLRTAAGFIEKWLPSSDDKDLEEIIEERDRVCFKEAKDDVEIAPKRREQIIKVLRRAAFSILLFAVCLPVAEAAGEQDVASQAKEAFESAKFDEAASLWLDAGPFEDLSADTMYNIGNAAYRMGAPGQAALYYRRALARDIGHEEARQNLRFIERKYGSITIDRPSYQYTLSRFSLSSWKGAVWVGSWMLLLGLLVFPATRSGSRWRVAGVVSFIVGPLLMSVGGLGSYHYPDDAEFAPLAKQAVIVGEKVVLHTDAARTSPEVIDAPAGSLAEVIKRSGRWAYVSFATKTRGWVPTESLEMIIPEGKPAVPKVRKAAADGSSA